jgi:hypothetical protein
MIFLNVHAKGENGGSRPNNGGMVRDVPDRVTRTNNGMGRDPNTGRLVIPRVFPMRRDRAERIRNTRGTN